MKIIYVFLLLCICVQSLAHNSDDHNNDKNSLDSHNYKMGPDALEDITPKGKESEKSTDLYILFLFSIAITVFIILIILFLVTVLNICAGSNFDVNLNFHILKGFVIAYQWPHPRFLFWKESHSDRSNSICCCFPLYQMNYGLAIIWLILLSFSLILMSWITAIISGLILVLLIFANLLLHRKYVEAGWPVNLADIAPVVTNVNFKCNVKYYLKHVMNE